MIMKFLNMLSDMFTPDDIDDEEYDEIVDSLNNIRLKKLRDQANIREMEED